MTYNRNKELYHFGVLGMKWGHRKSRSASSSSSKTSNPEHKFLRDTQKRNVSSLSNEELARANTRLSLENNYRNLNRQDISSGKSFVRNVAIGAATVAVSALVSRYANKGANALDSKVSSATKKAAGAAVRLVRHRNGRGA